MENKESLIEKVFLFGFMPLGEAAGVVAGDLVEIPTPMEIRKHWIKKAQAAQKLAETDPYVVDDSNIDMVIKDFEPEHRDKLQEIEEYIMTIPLYREFPHEIKLVEIDKLIALQNNINLNRVERFSQSVNKESTMFELLDFTLGRRKYSSKIESNLVSNNSYLFSSDDEDVRISGPEIKELPRYDDPVSEQKSTAFILKVTSGEPFIYALKTSSLKIGYMQKLGQVIQGYAKGYQITLQNGFHRAYALKRLGFTHIPCIIIEPVSAQEIQLLNSNWLPERWQQVTSPRPPLLKDFFNPDLCETVKVRTRKTCWKITWNIERMSPPV